MKNNPFFSLPFICSILLNLFTLAISGECLGSQQSFLLQFKNSLDFCGYSKLVNWNASSDCCSWEGVTCEGGHVTRLDLSGARIYGKLDNSSTLFNLQHLNSLDLSDNFFNSTIPSRIGNLTNLSHLNLAYAGFRGQIPISISWLKCLVTLDLSSNKKNVEIQNLSLLVQKLSKLRELHLDGVNISSPGNRWCQALSSSLPNLRVLRLSNCHVPGPLDESLGELHSLSIVNLQGTNLSSPVPQSFAKFSNLTFLNLRYCGLQGTFPSGIFQVPTLEFIDISSNKFLQGTLPEFQINNSLQKLYLSFTKFAGRLPRSLGNLWNLTTLDLSMCQFNGILPSSMSNLTNIVRVDLSQNNFTGLLPYFNYLSTRLSTIDFSHNGLTGEIPLCLFTLPSLKIIRFCNNKLSGPIVEFDAMSSSALIIVDLSLNNLEGLIPTSIFKLGNLTSLDLSYNKFNGTKQCQMFPAYSNLLNLDLSHNNLRSFPDLKNLSDLEILDLSDNQISGEIPKWIWEVGNKSLVYLNLSYNYLVGMQEPFSFPKSLRTLDLHFNQLQGNIPVLPQIPVYVDLSSNRFSSLPYDSFNNYTFISFFSLSNNSLTGDISELICSFKYLFALDLSHNNLTGRIPTCLVETRNLRMLNLHNNNLKGPIPDVFLKGCKFKAINLNGNLLEGEIPKSLANCLELVVLDLGHNGLIGEFPCVLNNISSLHVIILRSNRLYGGIKCPNVCGSWPMLQIFDLAHNNLSGELPRQWLMKFQRMMVDEDDAHTEILRLTYRYAYSVMVTSKGLEMELVKILDIFTYIDLSQNNFHGQIPEELGQLRALYILNLSHNALVGKIPSSIGNLRNLESLDLSWNNLSGRIPTQLQSLNFLSFLNLSFNHLFGMIPAGNQLQTFSEDSYIGNRGLCGFPLTKNCSEKAAGTFSSNAGKDNRSNSGRNIDWNLLSAEIGLFTGFGIVVAPLVFSWRWRRWYYERVDDIIIEIFPLAVSRKWFQWTSP